MDPNQQYKFATPSDDSMTWTSQPILQKRSHWNSMSTAPPPPPSKPSPWDAHAAVYEQVWERSTSLWGRDALVLGRLPDPANARLLDVACGAGSLAITAASMGFDVTATDLSAGMISKLQAKIAASGTAHKIHASVKDGQTLEGIDGASFDVVSSIFGIFLFPDREAAWRSAHRVLKPGGQLIASSWDDSSSNAGMIRYLKEKAMDKPSGQAPEGTQVIVPLNRTMFAASFRDELEECGFRDVKIHTLTHPMCFKSGEELVHGVWDNVAIRMVLANKDELSVKRCVLEFTQMMLDNVDPFAVNVETGSDVTKLEDHALWNTPFAIPATAHVAVATK